FLDRFAGRTLDGRFAVLHEAGRQRPVAVARVDRTLAQQHAIAPDRDRSEHHVRILIMDRAAVRATVARAVVAGRNAERDFMATERTEFHCDDSGIAAVYQRGRCVDAPTSRRRCSDQRLRFAGPRLGTGLARSESKLAGHSIERPASTESWL